MSIATDLLTIAENTPKVYEAGKDAEAKSFWGGLLNYGNPKRHAYAFYGWNRDIFYPQYNIVCEDNMGSMFHFFEQNSSTPFDLSARLKECGVVLDTSGAITGGTYTFYYTSFSKIPTVDLTGITDGEKLTYMFGNNGHLVEIEKLIVKEGNAFNVTFAKCPNLEKLIIEGVIGRNGFDVRQSTKLSKESHISIIDALSQTASGLTVTFSKQAVNNAFGINVDNPSTYPEGSEFYELRNSRNNWTFNYA